MGSLGSRSLVVNGTLWKLCQSCWDGKPANRPDVASIVSSLKRLRNLEGNPSHRHPCLQKPLLYISNLPTNIPDAALTQVLENCVPFHIQIARDGSERPLAGTVEFNNLEKGVYTISKDPRSFFAFHPERP